VPPALVKNIDNFYIIIDFDNFFRDDKYIDNPSYFANELNDLVDTVVDLNKTAEYLSIRFYGGWLVNGVWTNIASRLQQTIQSIDYFPVLKHADKKKIYGDIELVTRLVGLPEIEWTNTLREKNGLPRLRLKKSGLPDGCAKDNEICPARILYRFTKSKMKSCPSQSCNVKNSDAFKVLEQKMVDTMISCDIIELSSKGELGGMLVVSDDYDLLPALAIGTNRLSLKSKVICLLRNSAVIDMNIFGDLISMGLVLKTKNGGD